MECFNCAQDIINQFRPITRIFLLIFIKIYATFYYDFCHRASADDSWNIKIFGKLVLFHDGIFRTRPDRQFFLFGRLDF